MEPERQIFDVMGKLIRPGQEVLIESGGGIFPAVVEKFTHQSIKFVARPTARYPKLNFERFIVDRLCPLKVYILNE